MSCHQLLHFIYLFNKYLVSSVCHFLSYNEKENGLCLALWSIDSPWGEIQKGWVYPWLSKQGVHNAAEVRELRSWSSENNLGCQLYSISYTQDWIAC